MSTIGFLGPRGTFTEGAAHQYAAALKAKIHKTVVSELPRPALFAYEDIPELLTAVARKEVGAAVVPVENSIEGTVNVTIDTLVHDVDLRVVAEVVLPIRHHLLVRTGRASQPIHTVISHPQALAQCRRYLDGHLPGVTLEAALSTAAAAQAVAASSGGVAAIGNALCAQLYDLTVLASDIQDELTNATRFFVLRTPEMGKTGPLSGGTDAQKGISYKTSVAFAFAQDGPGNLYGALGEFARHGVNLTKLESRPARQGLGHYIFLVDMEGHMDEPAVASALAALRTECPFVKVLGSYTRVEDSFTPRPTIEPTEPRDSRSL